MSEKRLTTKELLEYLINDSLSEMVCCFCLNVSQKLNSLNNLVHFIGEDHNQKCLLGDIIEKVTGTQISKDEDDRLPNKICDVCFKSILAAYQFINKYQRCRQALENCIDYFMTLFQDVVLTDRVDEMFVESPRHYVDQFIETKLEFECTRCPEDFKTKSELNQHSTTHPDTTQHVCRSCDKKFSTKLYLKRHVKINHEKIDNLTCHICQKKANCLYNLKRHHRTHFPDMSEKKHQVICDICSAQFDGLPNLKQHKKVHLSFPCTVCQRQFKAQRSLSNHMRKHELGNSKRLNCTHCSYTAHNNRSLDSHINRIHLKIRPFTCDLCSKAYYSKKCLDEHKILHTNFRRSSCNVCGSTFVNKKYLDIHMRLHTGVCPYKCDLCEASFISASRRKAHIERKHNDLCIDWNSTLDLQEVLNF